MNINISSRICVQELINNEISSLWMIEVDKQAPVNHPSSLLQDHQIRVEGLKQGKEI
jgi:hypothetical protein